MRPKASEVPTVKRKKEEGKVSVKDKDREIEKRVVRVKYLMEKYGFRWIHVIRSSKLVKSLEEYYLVYNHFKYIIDKTYSIIIPLVIGNNLLFVLDLFC